MKTHSVKYNFALVVVGLLLGLMSNSIAAKHAEVKVEAGQELYPDLCEKVAGYDDWRLVREQWVSERYDLERFNWRAAKGYPVKDSKFYERTDYDQYSTETLMRLAQDGDKAANLELAQRNYYFRSGSLSNAEPYCYMAVVDGFSGITSCMISSYGEKVVKQMAKDQGKQSDQEFKLRLELLGWIEYSLGLDDLFAQRFAEILKPGYQRDDISQAMISESAAAIRKKIYKTRSQRKQYKETLTVDIEQEMPILWRYLEQNKLEEQAINSCLQESQYAKQ
ncbi:MAG: hypothetical protein OQJ95_09310 [Kangiella sp.]|jgi:hypothetical protein|nr:hypothetical protein [Kangiella sp.]MCW9028915.1 hypothetical protein [Kangiella sp.]